MPFLPHSRCRQVLFRWAPSCWVLPCGALITLAAFDAAQPSVALAQTPPTLSGRWQASPMRSVWVVGEWDAACGAKPSGGDQAGEFVTIKQAGGELSISGARSLSTAGCTHGGGDLQLAQHSKSPRNWTSVCKSPSESERQVVVRTTINATDSAIQFDESGQYQFRAGEHSCTASSRRTRQYELVERWEQAGVPEPSEGPPSAPSNASAQTVPLKDRCADPGPAASVELKPRHKMLAPGGSAEFEVSIKDAAGCPLSANLASYSIEPAAAGLQFAPPRTLSAASDTTEAETELVVRAGNATTSAKISLVSQARYDELMSTGQGAPGTFTAPDATSSAMPALGAATAIAENRAGTRKVWFGAFVGLTAAALGALGLVLLRQARARNPNTGGLGHVHASGANGSELSDPQQRAATSSVPPPVPKICPTCGLMYGSEAQFCGKDGSYLVQAN